MSCDGCRGRGCAGCAHRGHHLVTECPQRWARDALALLVLVDHARRGSWPAAGGTLDQTAMCLACIEAVRVAELEELAKP